MAALPSNTAAILYNKGVGVKAAAVVGEGMLSVLSTDPSVQSVSDLVGATVSVPGRTGLPTKWPGC
jgi:NitT/TauT family transport system substrate-binding protein